MSPRNEFEADLVMLLAFTDLGYFITPYRNAVTVTIGTGGEAKSFQDVASHAGFHRIYVAIRDWLRSSPVWQKRQAGLGLVLQTLER